eukprot:GFYU01003789.1.p1 GENE.GFYU01003789.1~~GFYU01003789.1.p1  ORF type:complete len:601 (+),score=168.15 GFYU01003789.1:216-1805(+)
MVFEGKYEMKDVGSITIDPTTIEDLKNIQICQTAKINLPNLNDIQMCIYTKYVESKPGQYVLWAPDAVVKGTAQTWGEQRYSLDMPAIMIGKDCGAMDNDSAACLKDKDCGWCGNTKRCMAGQPFPEGADCDMCDNCSWNFDIDPNCDTCISKHDNACGWCAFDGLCVKRDSQDCPPDGPLIDTCTPTVPASPQKKESKKNALGPLFVIFVWFVGLAQWLMFVYIQHDELKKSRGEGGRRDSTSNLLGEGGDGKTPGDSEMHYALLQDTLDTVSTLSSRGQIKLMKLLESGERLIWSSSPMVIWSTWQFAAVHGTGCFVALITVCADANSNVDGADTTLLILGLIFSIVIILLTQQARTTAYGLTNKGAIIIQNHVTIFMPGTTSHVKYEQMNISPVITMVQNRSAGSIKFYTNKGVPSGFDFIADVQKAEQIIRGKTADGGNSSNASAAAYGGSAPTSGGGSYGGSSVGSGYDTNVTSSYSTPVAATPSIPSLEDPTVTGTAPPPTYGYDAPEAPGVEEGTGYENSQI